MTILTALPLTSFGTILVVAFTFYASMGAGKMRGNVKAPATTGDIEFEKAFRVHYNTIEQLVIFLPLLWLSAPYWGDFFGGTTAIVWVIGRMIYARAYRTDPSNRTLGFVITLLAFLAVFLGSIIPLGMMFF